MEEGRVVFDTDDEDQTFPIALEDSCPKFIIGDPPRFSVACRFRRTGPGPWLKFYEGLVCKVGVENHVTYSGFKFGFEGNTGTLRFDCSQHSSFYSTANNPRPVNDGLWHVAVAVCAEDTIRLYVDGISGPAVGTSDDRGVQAVKRFGRVDSIAPMVLGHDTYHRDRVLEDALISHVVTFDRDLSEEEVATLDLTWDDTVLTKGAK